MRATFLVFFLFVFFLLLPLVSGQLGPHGLDMSPVKQINKYKTSVFTGLGHGISR